LGETPFSGLCGESYRRLFGTRELKSAGRFLIQLINLAILGCCRSASIE